MKELDYYLKDQNCKGNVTVDKVSNKEYPIDTEYITAYGSWYK